MNNPSFSAGSGAGGVLATLAIVGGLHIVDASGAH